MALISMKSLNNSNNNNHRPALDCAERKDAPREWPRDREPLAAGRHIYICMYVYIYIYIYIYIYKQFTINILTVVSTH